MVLDGLEQPGRQGILKIIRCREIQANYRQIPNKQYQNTKPGQGFETSIKRRK